MGVQYVDLDYVETAFESAMKSPMIPDEVDFPRFKSGHVFDEEKSVRWNREEVERLNELYDKEKDRLKKAANKKFEEAKSLAKSFIQFHTECNENQASVIFSYVYEHYHSILSDFFEKLDEITFLFRDFVLEGKRGPAND